MKNKKNKNKNKDKDNKNSKNDLSILEEYEYNIETIEQNECLEDGSFIEININEIENKL